MGPFVRYSLIQQIFATNDVTFPLQALRTDHAGGAHQTGSGLEHRCYESTGRESLAQGGKAFLGICELPDGGAERVAGREGQGLPDKGAA